MSIVLDGTSGITAPSVTGTPVIGGLVSGTAVTASGTSVDFTDIPSWVKRITVMFAGVSTSGTSITQIQLGDSDGFETSGYIGGATRVDGSIGSSGYSAGYLLANQQQAASIYSGGWVINKIDGNTWVENHTIGESTGEANIGGGTKILSDTLTQVRITTVNGTDTFDAGSINIMYEG